MPAWLIPAITALGGVLGGAAKGSADSRNDYNTQILGANRNAIDLFGTQQRAATDTYRTLQDALMRMLESEERGKMDRGRLDLDRRKFSVDAPLQRGKASVLGSLMQNMQPVRLTGLSPQLQSRMPTFTGGLSPAALGPLARAMGLRMQQDALRSQEQGDQFPDIAPTDFRSGMVDPKAYALPAPQLQGLKQAGLLEKILGVAGLGGGIFGALNNAGLFGGGRSGGMGSETGYRAGG